MSGLNEKIAVLNAEKAALVTEAHGLRGEELVKQSVQVQTKLVEEATQVAFEKEQATEVAYEKEQALMLKKQQALEACVEELRKQIAELEEGEAVTKVKMSELVDREKTLSTEKSDLLLLKLKESSEVDTVDAQLSSGVDAKTSKALKSLRNKLQERLAKVARRLQEIAAARTENLERIMNACQWVTHVPQVVYNGKAYSSIMEWATQQRLRMERPPSEAPEEVEMPILADLMFAAEPTKISTLYITHKLLILNCATKALQHCV